MPATKQGSEAVSYVSTVREMTIPNRGGTPIRFQGGTYSTTDPDLIERIESSGEYGKRIHRAPIGPTPQSDPLPEGEGSGDEDSDPSAKQSKGKK